MTGPDHYREAERLLTRAAAAPGDLAATGRVSESVGLAVVANLVAVAQAHATLALVAATAEPIAQSYDGPNDTTIPSAWSAAIS